jgi:hypothetical protein
MGGTGLTTGFFLAKLATIQFCPELGVGQRTVVRFHNTLLERRVSTIANHPRGGNNPPIGHS